MRIQNQDNLYDLRESGRKKLLPDVPVIGIGLGTCGLGNGADAVMQALKDALSEKGVEARLRPVGCFGFCAAEPLVNVRLPNKPLVMLHRVRPEDAPAIVEAIAAGDPPAQNVLCKIESWDHLTHQITYGADYPDIPSWQEIPFFRGQQRMVLRNCGLINPEDIDEYIAVGGYDALFQALQKPNSAEVIEEIKKSKLRGRGGAGYPTGDKWSMLHQARAGQKYIICNADEGDPGAYMNRNEIESDPHMLLEGMLIGAYAMGATEGIVYLRAEYPLAVERLQLAIRQARDYGLVGEQVMGSDVSFEIKLVEGAGAFVCGEETAMIASLEGKSGRPRPRPPYPAASGLWGQPTNINNVETWCNVPVILSKGGAWFAASGTSNSSGTKVFSLVGKIKNTGLVELPMGAPLRNLIYEIGQGSPTGKTIKAIQTGGPSGGCIPAELFDTPVDYESLSALGAIMGSGGMVVMDEDTCMVDVARYFIEFSHSESCGKCVPCRVGLDQALRMLTRITDGEADPGEVDDLEQLGHMVKECSLCGLGQTAPNPVLTTLRYFRHEYDQHIRAKRCEAGVCETLFLAPCENRCPLHMRIPGYLQLTKEERFDEAAEMVWRDNPLPASTGRVCQHPCESLCRRATLDTPVNMREVHRFLADSIMEDDQFKRIQVRLIEGCLPATGKKVHVAGAGPAGLTAAFYLALLGHEVTVYEERPDAGGMLRYALPEYRLPKAALDREIDLIRSLGVRFEFNRRVGDDLPMDEFTANADAAFLSIGTWQEVASGVQDEEGPGVWHAIQLLDLVARGDAPALGSQVVVIGGGNAAIDSARTAVRLGAEVQVVYRRAREDMPAIREEVEDAESEGVGLTFFAAPERVVRDENGRITGIEVAEMQPGAFDRSGRRRPEPTGNRRLIPCTAIVMAVGEIPDTEALVAQGVPVDRKGRIAADPITLAAETPALYAGGDVVHGASNVTIAMGSAKQACRSIDRFLTGNDRFHQVLGEFSYTMEIPPVSAEIPRQSSPHLPPQQRKTRFDEVLLGISREEAMAESCRCLRCDVKETCATAPAAVLGAELPS